MSTDLLRVDLTGPITSEQSARREPVVPRPSTSNVQHYAAEGAVRIWVALLARLNIQHPRRVCAFGGSERAIISCGAFAPMYLLGFNNDPWPRLEHRSTAMRRWHLNETPQAHPFLGCWMSDVEPSAIGSSTFNSGRPLGVMLDVDGRPLHSFHQIPVSKAPLTCFPRSRRQSQLLFFPLPN